MNVGRTAPGQGVALINGDLGGITSALRIHESRIVSVDQNPQRGDLVIDLHGDRLLPGLINAHDHLQLNHFGRLKYRDQYLNVCDWITDVAASMQTSLTLRTSAALLRDQRLLFGGLKSILSGVTTVAHHDPLYGYLTADAYPVRVMTQYGWSHSLLVDGEERVRASWQQTPATSPWIIHAAEGVDDEAAAEFERLDALGCIGANTLIVHGVALNRDQRNRLAEAQGGLIWCPSSNLHLFGQTADIADLVNRGRVALGSDSRLSGERDLLRELNVAREISALDESTLESLVTSCGARLLRLADRGVLKTGAGADVLILPAKMPLSRATRADVRLVMIGGRAIYGDLDYAAVIAPASQWCEVRVDGRTKAMNRRLAALIVQSGIREPGFEVAAAAWRAA